MEDKLYFIEDILKLYEQKYGKEEAYLAEKLYSWWQKELDKEIRETDEIAWKIPMLGRINMTGYTAQDALRNAEESLNKVYKYGRKNAIKQEVNADWARRKAKEVTRRMEEQRQEGLWYKKHWLMIKGKNRKYLLNG
jgi:hypothetical protein